MTKQLQIITIKCIAIAILGVASMVCGIASMLALFGNDISLGCIALIAGLAIVGGMALWERAKEW